MFLAFQTLDTMVTYRPLFLSAVLAFVLTGQSSGTAPERSGWAEITTVRQLWKKYPGRIRKVLEAVDPGYPGLEMVSSGLEAGDTIAAAESLLEYYRRSDAADWLVRQSVEGEEAEWLDLARMITHDSISLNGTTAAIPRNPDGGGWKWDYTGPDEDAEFAYSLNGHRYLTAVLGAWRSTGDEVFIRAFDRLIRDWTLHNPLPAEGSPMYRVFTDPKLDWRDIGETAWRDLDAGRRMEGSWPQAFHTFQSSGAFTPAARLLMLSGFAEHAAYLRKYHKKGHNWTTMEMNGLALVGLTFPEFKEAKVWTDYAMQTMETEIQRQVYPDGVQTEVSTKTQWVALKPFETIAANFQLAGRAVSADYTARLEDMYNYLAYAMRPDGHQPLNNDSDREDLRPRVLKAAGKFNRPDWAWIATNGASGQQPEGLPSVVFPWAGLHIMRSGWDGQAHWTFFDTGPFGTGHQHADMLHFSISAYGKDLLVDGGRYTHKDYFSFDPANWRGYFRSSFSHNVILVDGKGQNAGPLRAAAPLPESDYANTPEFDFARGAFTGGYEGVEGRAEHTRSVLYIRGKYWIIIDRIETDRPRELSVLWHFEPNCTVAAEKGGRLVARNGDANLQFIPLGPTLPQPEIIAGQEKPVIQGWYSAEYGIKVPNPTAVYTLKNAGSLTLVWLLVPSSGQMPDVKGWYSLSDDGAMNFKIRQGKADPVTAKVYMTGIPQVEGVSSR